MFNPTTGQGLFKAICVTASATAGLLVASYLAGLGVGVITSLFCAAFFTILAD